MIKKIICGALAVLCVASFAGCGATKSKSTDSNGSSSAAPVETKPEKVNDIHPAMSTSEYAYYIPTYEWVNAETGDTINFENSGNFSGKVNGKQYSGKFTLQANANVLGRVDSSVTLEGAENPAGWTIDFKNTCEMYVTTGDGNREYFAAKWWLDKGNKPEDLTGSAYNFTKDTAVGYYYDFLAQDWTDEKNGNTFSFDIDGNFNGKIKSKTYKGIYKISSFGDKAGSLVLAVNIDKKGPYTTYKAEFDTSKKLTISVSKDKSESFEAK